MALTVETYFNINEKTELLQSFYAEHGGCALFIVPSGLDKEALLALVCGETAYFGARPQVMTTGDLYKELSRLSGARLRVIDPPDHNLIIKYLLERFFAEAAARGLSLAGGVYHKGFVSVLGDNIKDMLNEEASPARLREALFGEEEPAADAPEALLLELYEKYLDYLAEYGLADAAQIATLARQSLLCAEAASWLCEKHVLFAGFLSFTGAQLKLARAIADICHTTMLQPETGLDDFHDGIKQLGAPYLARPKWRLPTALFSASGAHLEFEALARELALWADGGGVFAPLCADAVDYGDIGVMAQPHRMALLEYALGRYNIPYNAQARGTVGETLLGELPAALWGAFRSGWDHYHTKLLLANPLLFARADSTTPLAPEGVFPDNFEAWHDVLRGDEKKNLRAARKLCEGFERGGTPVELLSLWLAFIEKSGAAARCADAAGRLPQLDGCVKDIFYAVYELKKKIKNLSDEAKEIGPAARVPLRGAEAAAFITDWGATATLPISAPQRRSVTLYAGAPPILASHRFWIMTDVDYNTWPGTMRESLLMRGANKAKFNAAEAERAKAGVFDDLSGGVSHLPEPREEREQKEAVFRRLTATAREGLIIARSLTDMKKDPVGESQFVQSMVTYADAAKNTVKKEADRSWPEALCVNYPSDCALPDGGSPWFPEAEVVCSPFSRGEQSRPPVGAAPPREKPVVRISDLDLWRSCPYLYWCTAKLRLESPRLSLYDPRRAGVLFHRIWEECLTKRAAGERILIQSYAAANWERFKEELYPELAREPRLARYELMLRRQMTAMAAFEDEIEERAVCAGRSGVETELRLDDYEIDGVLFRAAADRVDYYGGDAVVLDYKLGKAENHVSELQIPAYCKILKETSGVAIKGVGWLGHRDTSIKGYFDDGYGDIYGCPNTGRKQTVSERIEEAGVAMAQMAEAVKNGCFVPNYDPKDKRCQRCGFFVMCRKREDARFTEALEDGSDDE
ncbi:MAG: PD-(D/E)XK nuclease family protein [Cloacibacillus sp.]